MKRPLDQKLAEVAEQTFESLAFMFSMPEKAEHTVAVSIGFSGPAEGKLFVWMPQSSLPTLATNMLGMDDGDGEPTAAQQHDSLKELANVICGNLLPKVAGVRAVFQLGQPEIIPDGAIAEVPEQRPAGKTHITLDSGNADIELYIDSVPVAPDSE